MGLRAFKVNIIGLSNKVHHFDFEVGNEFFAHYGTDLISAGSFHAEVVLDKHETFIEARFIIKGQAKLICDRSLDPFEYPISVDKKIMFKYGDTEQELSDEIVVINREADSLELGQYIYEFISLQVPYKKLHPRYKGEPEIPEESEGKIIYSSKTAEDDGPENDIDPRWEKLKKLK